MRPEELLDPGVLDDLPLIGEGSSARVFAHGRYAIKVAHPDRRSRRRLADEIETFAALADSPLRVPRLYLSDKQRGLLVRSLLPGASLSQRLAGDPALVTEALLDEIGELAAQAEQCSVELGRLLDLCPANLFAHPRSGLWHLVDLGERLDSARYFGMSRQALRDALLDDAAWRRRHLRRAGQLDRFYMPPTGRFAVEVDAGPVAGARLLWVNRPLRGRLQLDWSDRRLLQLGSLATFAARADRQLLATRYQDSPGTGEGQAQGDGRVLMLGCVEGGPHGQREFSLKGCGATPLAWHGHAYHFDGLVSFNRSLWEAAICDELRRLGFDSPEVLALIDNGARTIDNTEQEWPAATAIRVSHTHLRLGHLYRWSAQPEMLRHMVNQAGRRFWGPDFSARRQGDVLRLLGMFVHNLAYNCGKSDALNVHGFNPTLGNLRVDGHFIDFSTVRLQAHCMPDYRYLDGKRRVREHRAGLRSHLPRLVQLISSGGLLPVKRAPRVRQTLLHLFDCRDAQGYLAGLARLLDLECLDPEPALARVLVAETRRLRALRSGTHIDYPLWQQNHAGPLFDLENQLPEFAQAVSHGLREPWRALLWKKADTVDAFAAQVARDWCAVLKRALPRRTWRSLDPVRWSDIVRPQLENNRLAELCYRQSTPKNFTAWRRAVRH